jgi:hypothetical protein
MDLQNTFYILAIILMSLIFIMLAALVVAVIAIRIKIAAIHKMIEDKVNLVSNVANAGATILKKAREAVDKHS